MILMARRLRLAGLVLAAWLPPPMAAALAEAPGGRWITAWASAVMPGEAAPDVSLENATLRQQVRVSIGGRRIRLRLSNDHGPEPLTIRAVRVAKGSMAAEGGLAPLAPSRQAAFDGAPQATIPAGASLLSDAIDLPVAAGEAITLSIAFAAPPARQSVHVLALSTGYVAPGDQTAAKRLAHPRRTTRWGQLGAVEVERPAGSSGAVIAVLGDSITDGHGARLDRDERWTDVLAQRLRADRAFDGVAVLNLGIAGNRLARDGAALSGLARLDRDILAQSGVTTLIVLMGVNDLGLISREGPVTPEARSAAVEGLIDGYKQLIHRARARGLRVIGATLAPFGGTAVYRSDDAADEDRRRVNRWIRTSGAFDAIIDFDAVLRDPVAPARLAPAYDSGDHLHPSPAGYRAMGEAVPLSILRAGR